MTLRGLLDNLATQVEALHDQFRDAANLAADEGYAPMLVRDVEDIADALDATTCQINQTREQLRSIHAV